jgi:hypothetical protein
MNLLDKISKLPDDIIKMIKEFIPQYKLVFVNLYYYNIFHSYVRNMIPLYENYIRDTIRRDNDFVIDKIIGSLSTSDKHLSGTSTLYGQD